MVGAVLDLDGVYDPTLTNDRLFHGMKRTISEFELNLFRQRSSEAILQKARRGELQIQIPVGFCWAPSGLLEKDPDQRVQQAIQLVFRKMTELGSVRQVPVWFLQENLSLPSFPHDSVEREMVWKLPGRSCPQKRGPPQAAKRMEGHHVSVSRNHGLISFILFSLHAVRNDVRQSSEAAEQLLGFSPPPFAMCAILPAPPTSIAGTRFQMRSWS
jgi:hypothetical protein